MILQQGLVQSLISNWVTIAVTVLATGVTLFVSIRYQTNAREERLNQAKDSVISVIEEHVIDSKNLSIDKIENLIRAAEREHTVPLGEKVSKTSLLEDLELKIERSPHLNTEQKQEYTAQIQEYIEDIKESKKDRSVSRNREEILESIMDNIESGNTEDAKKDVKLIKEEISKLEEKSQIEAVSHESILNIPWVGFIIIVFMVWFFVFNELVGLAELGITPTMLAITLLMAMLLWARVNSY